MKRKVVFIRHEDWKDRFEKTINDLFAPLDKGYYPQCVMIENSAGVLFECDYRKIEK
jgi:hypothetical protein